MNGDQLDLLAGFDNWDVFQEPDPDNDDDEPGPPGCGCAGGAE